MQQEQSEWLPWQKKFAWLPVTLTNGDRVWLKSYYRRVSRRIVLGTINRDRKEQNGTLFDILKDPDQ